MMLAVSVSSSMVINITPLAEPGFWCTSTSPATVTSWRSAARGLLSLRSLHLMRRSLDYELAYERLP
jgi:hypothetical protein